MRHNYFNLNQIKSNPDGQPTVKANVVPRYLKNLAMIFAVLTLSIANIGVVLGASTTIEFKTSTKDDSNVALAALANGDTRLVGGGLAKLIATNSVALNAAANKYGYRCDASRLYIVFKFDGETDLTIKHNANSTGARYMRLYSFSSAKALSAITSSDWSTKTQKSFSSTNTDTIWGGGQASSVTTNGDKTTWNYGTKGCLTVTWEDLPAGYYVLDGTGSEAYIYSFTADVTAASCSTPEAPTATSNGASTSTTQAISWTDAANEKWDVIMSTSSSTPAADATPTASNLTSKSYTFTGLSASTTYYWWVRSVCDATHKSSWYAGSSFTTPALVTYTLTTTVGTSGAATGGATITNGVVASIPSGTTVTNNGDNTFTINTASPTTVTASASVSGVAGPDDDACTYAFTGWENLPATVTADVSDIHALYEARFAIGFKETDGTAVAGISSTYYVYGTGKAVSTFPTPTKSGFTFAGWYTDVALTTPATDLDNEAYGAIDYYAKWEELICSISDCGNATLTYPLNVGTSLVNTAANLVSTPSNGGSAALTVPAANAAVTLSTITISATDGKKDNYGKAAATTSACYPTAPTMSSKIGMYNGASYSSSNYLQFAFTVNSGYTFTPCDIQFTVQPVSNIGNFRWEVTDGTKIYGYGVATDVPIGSSGGASVMTGLTSPTEMAAGDYYIRLYPYYNGSNTFRISNDVILKGTTASAAPSCTAPTDLAISGEYVHFPGETLTLTVSGDNIAQDATYTWKKGDQVIAGQTTATLTINSCEITDAGNYTCTISNGGSCEATANYTVKMYSLRGLTDNNWTTDFVFTKVNATTATYSMELTGSSSYDFKVYDGSAYYGNTGGNPTMTSDNCTNWTMQENMGNNVTLQTTAAGTYTFTLNYTNASNPTISVTYPAKRIVYLNPGVWYTGENQEKFVVHAWYSSTVQDILMTKIDDCADRNIYQAEIDANHEQVIFIRVNPAGLNLSNPWSNEWNRTKDLTLISENQFTINNWGGTGEWNYGTEKSSGAWENFTPNYTVTFDANGHGTAPDAQCVAKNGRATTPAAPTATGYTFGGWYKEAGCINAYDFNTEVTSNITLYAKWTAETYNIKYFEAIGDDATGQDLRELTIGGAIATYTIEDEITLPELPAKDGYTATGWYTKWCVFPDDGGNGNGWEGCTPIMIQPVGYYGHTNFIVKYTPNTYTITWNANGGNALTGTYTSGNVNYGAAITKPADPTRTGYTFAGWHNGTSIVTPAATMPANDVTYTAQWTCTTPTISTQPINATYTQNTAAAALSVTATANDGTLSYQWQSSTDNSNFTNISGATGNEYTPSTTEVGTTYYRCVVTNTTGSCIVTSASATITVTAASVEPDPEPEAVPQVGTFTGAGTSGMVNLYWTMPTKPVTTTVDIASATLSTAEGQSTGATSTITKENTNEIKVVYSTTEGWQATGVKIPLATPKTNVESITFEYKSYPSQNVDLIPFLYDGTRWVESDFVQLTPTEWTSHTSVITQEAWNNSNIYSTDKTILSVNFYANPGTVVENGTFYIRNVVLNRGTQVAAEGLIIVRKEGSNPTSPTDTDGTIVYNGDGIAATCTDDGLENGTTYHYAAYAHDGQGNYSEPLYWQYTYREGLNTYAPDDTDFPNPERGFYEQVQWNSDKGYEAVIGDSYFDDARAANRSLILRIYYMDSETLRNHQLPDDFITMFNEDMKKFRNNGMKCILRFAYDENSGDGYQDASPETWATHLAQLGEHLQANADVIYVVQAGFLGVWGEWYYSSQGTGNAILPNTKNNLIDQLLAAVPANRCVQLRTPKFKKEYLGNNNPLTSAVAYKGTAQARLGHHNDAFLNGEQNQGTYENRATDMAYIAQECLYVPIGGETNLEESQVAELYEAYCKGTVAEAEMAQLHYSYLNYSYSTVVTNRWKAEGSYARMSKYMGYRFELASASLPNEATAGTQMNVQLNIKNVGYAPLYNERHAYIVFKNNTNTYSIQLSSDPRTWPNSAVTPIDENIALPADMVAGTYDMYLHLPDASASIANNPKYAVRFANQGIWESETGYNKLNKQVVVTATEAAVLTALECNTRYTVQDMTAGGCGTLSGTSCYSAGLSANSRFEVLGDPSKTDQAGGTPEQKTNDAQEINSISFNSFMYLKGDGLNGSTEPTCRGVKFIIPSAGRLTIYYRYGDRSKLKKEGESAVDVGTTTGGYGYDTHDVTAGTYYIYGTSSGAVLIAVEYQCCTTPAAPTAFSAGSITSTGATFSITDAADAASYDIYYSTSSDAPNESTPATTTSTSKTKAVTGLTASTTYYAWVRSVCDASNKSAWVALAGSSFTTTAAGPEALVHWTLNLNSNTWGTSTTPTTTDGTNITSISTSADSEDGTREGTTKKVSLASASDNVDKAASFTFTVNSAKKVEPERVTCQVFNVGGSSGGQLSYKAQLSDNNGHIYYSTNTVVPASEAKLTDATFTFASDLVLTGNVTIKVYGWKSGSAGSAFRMGADVKLFGEVQNAADYTVTHTMSNVTKSAGETSVKEGNNYTATYAGAGGYALPSTITVTIGDSPATAGTYYTWTQGTGVVTIPGNKVTGNIVITVTGVAVVNYSITYHCNGAESGCPSDVAATTNLPSPLPTGLTKDGFDFGGWFTDSECTVAAVAGAALTGNTDLYAKWTERGSECEDTPHAWDVIATSAKSYKVRISKVTEEVAIPIADATASNLTAYAGTSSTSDNVTVQIADGGSSKYGYKFDGSKTYLKLVFSTPLVLNDTLVVGMTNASHNISFTTTATRSTTLSTSGGKLIIPAALAGQSTIYLWRGSGNTMCLRSFAVKHACDALPSCTTPVIPALSNQTVCEGTDIAAWNATVTNAAAIEAAGETVAYSWKKKGNDTELANTASFDLGASAAESQAGTYVVTVTVSKAGYASATATKEVTLTVNEATEVTAITADKATVYPTNSVTLTATANVTPNSWQWYTCTSAEGAGAAIISGAESASYNIASAGVAGTYYYKAVATGSCGTDEMVYTLTVSAAAGGDCETYYFFANAADATTNGVTQNEESFFSGASEGTSSNSTSITVDGNNLSITKRTSASAYSVVFTIPTGATATLYTNAKANNTSYPLTITRSSDSEVMEITNSTTLDNYTLADIPEGTWTLSSGSGKNWYYGAIIVKVCSGKACTDPEVTASADNTTACVGTSVTFTAANAHASATYQWQKLDGTWKIISGADASTYNIASVVAGDAGKYRVIASHDCHRTSNEVTLSVPSAPNFGSTVPASVSVMATLALSITDVEASDATSYAWYKSADATYDAGTDTKVGTSKELLLAADGEAAGATYYLFCVASNSCGSTTSGAITVNVTALVEEECATAGNESNDHEFSFENTKCSEATLDAKKVWSTNSRDKYLTYTAPEGKYFATAKVTVAHTGGTKCGYAYSTNGGTTWVVAELGGLSTTLTAITIELPANVNAFRISRNLTAQDGEKGSDSGNFYLAEACFTYENACTPTSVTPTTTSYEYNISTPADFEEPPFTVKHGEDIVNDAVLTYTSSNPAIATVDEEGSVTFEGMTGTVTITAAYAGTTIDEIEYCASEGSYTITVVCQDEEPKIIAATSTNLDGCNNSITLEAKMQDGNSFTGGTFQWYRDGEAIDGATSASYEVVRAGTYTVSRTYTCTTMSSNPAVVTNENPEPKVERLTPFQYYHVDKDYSDQMKDRHLFAVTSYGTSDGKRYHLTATRNGEALDLSSSTAFFTIPSSDNAVDTVMIDLNELEGKYNANDEIVITCAPIDNCNQVSTITSSITIHVIDQTPTLALICSGSSKAGGTRKTGELTEGGDFLTGYNVADLCQQTGNQTFDPNTEWGFYTELKEDYIVTPVNGYAQFNKLNYEPFDILLLTDYPKSSKSEAAQKIIDDMAELCDYRPLLSFKTHFQSDKWKDKTTGEYKYTKWVKKGFTTAPVVPKQSATYVNIVCYAHPMFKDIDNINDGYTFHDDDDPNQLVYQVLTGPGYEGDKGIQGFELADADNFVTIGLVHYNAIADTVKHDDHTHIRWSAEANDRLLVAMAERQTNIEARMMLFSLNCGAQSLQTEGGRRVILQCLKYLLETDPLEVADCRMTFDNGAGNTDFDLGNYEGTGTKGDGLWSTAANWGPDYLVVPGRNNDVRIAAPCIVDGVKTKVSVGNEVQETIQYYPEVLSIHITENGSLTIPANSSLTARSTILRADENGNVYPTNVADISLGSNAGGNASLILNNERGDTKAGVAMYSTAKADTDTYSAAASTWQYIGTPHSDVANAIYNYYDSWLYQYDTGTEGWVVIPNGGPLVPFRGYCVTHPERGHTYWMEGTLVSTTNQDITIPANKFVVVANSWTAPIQIKELTNDDMEGLTDKTIYFFNTGSDPEGDNTLTANATGDARWAEGTYISVPIHSASYTGDSIIPSMQGFYVVGGNADGTLHLDYERHVRAKRENVPSGPMHAPARIADTDNEPQVAKFLFRGKRYDDRLIILERPDFTRGYDSGWDGEQWGGNAAAPMSYVVTETRWDAVSAIPEYEGTVIAFRAGEDSEYTIHFDYDGMEDALYLLDTDTQIYTRVLKGNSYTFTCADKAEHNRFILTRKAPQIATGVGNVSGDEVQGTKAKKLLIEDKMFIMVNGVLYDATGKVVK